MLASLISLVITKDNQDIIVETFFRKQTNCDDHDYINRDSNTRFQSGYLYFLALLIMSIDGIEMLLGCGLNFYL